ncbi:hypothetical protein [Paraburkholderia domus]|uniref:hypothetical protein n=1 Tax=Paraburkholderia domus TaxID=2793075 RepID=UPI0019137698|nr:hypothetical protein [Paraburkholderia domus]MBK5061836.1 hypothetical protein [Burkholderia sp. R-70199]CAE6901398.1 hypothetical protein R70199_03716 [Paraburkholderia domus]
MTIETQQAADQVKEVLSEVEGTTVAPVYTDVRYPAWGSSTQDSILCEVKFAQFLDFVPFHAMRSDAHDHGRQIFDECLSGKHGAIKAYVGPTESPMLPSADPIEKLRAFLKENPDVAALL